MMKEIELKPCPFCGEREDLDYGIFNGTMQGFDYVQCQSCGAEIHAIHNGKYIAAEELWNRRAENMCMKNIELPEWGISLPPTKKIVLQEETT